MLGWKVRSDGLQPPGAATSPPIIPSSVGLPSNSMMSCSMTALLRARQASSCATAFEFGHEVGCYSALLLELRTMPCGSQGMATAVQRPAARRARDDGAAWPRPARMWPTRRHRGPCGGPGVSDPMRFRVGYVMSCL